MRHTLAALLILICLAAPALAQERPRKVQPIPTHTVEMRGDLLTISFTGSYEQTDGTVIPVEWLDAPMPHTLYVNADCHLRLKIAGAGKFTATVFYEHLEKVEWIAIETGIVGVPVALDLPARTQLTQAKQGFLHRLAGLWRLPIAVIVRTSLIDSQGAFYDTTRSWPR